MGYPLDKKGWKLFVLETRVFFVSRDITFYEYEFPGLSNSPELLSESRGVLYEDGSSYFRLDEPSLGFRLAQVSVPPNKPNSHVLVEEAAATEAEPPSAAAPTVTRRRSLVGGNGQGPPSHLRDYVLNSVRHSSPPPLFKSHCSSPSSGTSYPLTSFVSYDIFSSPHRGFLASINSGVEPRSYHQEIRDPGWCDAMKAEINPLEINGTWCLVDLPKDKKALHSRWVYKIKYKSNGSMERLKARLLGICDLHAPT
ncbi:hypothetical protein LIER_22381 [Lithospermum erythrorhizon]|uniref:Retroviral polymerase SH3-like domain-containing protein n=1 Tax=Lithospermum erythrorhizon TaxID=34254 RepID=A0AAV3QX44_LITER